MTPSWIVYLLVCSDGSYYTGISSNLPRRLATHALGKASKYTRSRLPIRLLARKEFPNKSEALREEARIKRLPRNKKPTAFPPCQ